MLSGFLGFYLYTKPLNHKFTPPLKTEARYPDMIQTPDRDRRGEERERKDTAFINVLLLYHFSLERNKKYQIQMEVNKMHILKWMSGHSL